MGTMRFDGRTAIVTGAGSNPGLGRAHALFLAERGARVVVNDIAPNCSLRTNDETASAEAVVAEIRRAGGEAVADMHSISSPDGAQALVETALSAFGQIDIVINNAGVCIVAPFDQMTTKDSRHHIEVNLLGSLWVCRAAWPHMRRQGYGRIINTGSGVMAGFALQHAYAASKGGIFSLTRALAAEGEDFGIKANILLPRAFTRMVMSQQDPASPWYANAQQQLPAEYVSPMMAVLAHEQCPVNGECFEAGGGTARRIYLAASEGSSAHQQTPESILADWASVMGTQATRERRYNDQDPRTWHIKPYRAHDTI